MNIHSPLRTETRGPIREAALQSMDPAGLCKFGRQCPTGVAVITAQGGAWRCCKDSWEPSLRGPAAQVVSSDLVRCGVCTSRLRMPKIGRCLVELTMISKH
jgi:hypothetical protein